MGYLRKLYDFVMLYLLCVLIDLIGHILGSRSTIRHIVLDPKISIRSTRIVACCEKDTTRSFILPYNIGCSRSRKDAVLSDDEFTDTVGRADLEYGLYRLGGEVPSIATNDKSGSFSIDRI